MTVTLSEQLRAAVLRAWQHPVNQNKLTCRHPELIDAIVLEVFVSLRPEPESDVTSSRFMAYLTEPVIDPLAETRSCELSYDFVELAEAKSAAG